MLILWSYFQKINFPAVKIYDFLSQVAENIITILENPPATTVTILEDGGETKKALLKLALIFG